MNKKKCNTCKLEKDLSCFRRDRNKKDGYRAKCTECITNNVQRIKIILFCQNFNCGKELTRYQKKYCSRSCSASTNNEIRKVDKYCTNTECGQLLTSRGKKLYCSVKCSVTVSSQQRLEQWLSTGIATVSSSPTHYIRLYILSQQKDRCGICGGFQIHNGRNLVFILDHINGNAEDNRRDNLRLICPNCDSQLETYKSKNRGNGRFSRRQRYAEGKSF